MSSSTSTRETLLTEKQAAEYLQLTPRFMQSRRQIGTGPRFVRISRRCVRYRQQDLDEWLENRVKASTSEG